MFEKDIFYYHSNHLGSTSYISSLNGQLSQHVEYIAFGEVLFEEHSSSFSLPYLFNGKELDRETNLSYYGARYLDMKTSLWLNIDPLAEKYPNIGGNVFCLNNPINMIDPDGKEVIEGESVKNDLIVGKAFDTFAKTKEGIKFLSQYAKKGQVIAGHKYDNDGKYHKKGVNLIFKAENLGEDGDRGNTSAITTKKGVDITFTINNNSRIHAQDNNTYDTSGNSCSQKAIDNKVKGIISRTITIFHETFIHGDMFTQDYLDNKKIDDSNITPSFKSQMAGYPEHFQHAEIQLGSNSANQLFNTEASSGIISANKMWSNGRHFSSPELKKMMWNFTGSYK